LYSAFDLFWFVIQEKPFLQNLFVSEIKEEGMRRSNSLDVGFFLPSISLKKFPQKDLHRLLFTNLRTIIPEFFSKISS
jgi:hypothetical protein